MKKTNKNRGLDFEYKPTNFSEFDKQKKNKSKIKKKGK